MFKLLFILIMVICNFSILFSQDSLNSTNYFPGINTLNLFSNKLVNTYIFNASAELNYSIFGGKFQLKQDYKGTTLKSAGLMSRDDETLKLSYNYPLMNNFYLITEHNWIYYSVSPSIGLNKLEKINIASGFFINYLSSSYLEIKGGIERNNQLGLNSVGPIINLKNSMSNFTAEGYDIRYDLAGDYLKLDRNRINADLEFKSNFYRKFDDFDKFSFDISYRLLNRDYLSPTVLSGWGLYSVESRLENKIMGDFKLDFAISNQLLGLLGLIYQNTKVGRYFKDYVSDYNISGVQRELNEMQLGLLAEGKLNLSNLILTSGVLFDVRTEKNDLENRYNIVGNDFDGLKKIESLRDNNSYRTRFYTKLNWPVSRSDTFKLDYSVSLYQYDTPAKENYDDRDEFSTLINSTYIHKFNNAFSAAITAEVQLYHLVFLKSQRSALNNWNRIFRLNPYFLWNAGPFSMKPEIEVLANYTVYDFEDVSPGVKSFSYRQIGYKDSVIIYLGKMLSLQSNINLRYFERGILFWKTFSESPQSNSFERFIKSLIYIDVVGETIKAGCGVRHYGLTQKSLMGSVSGLGDIGYSQISIGPETDIKIIFSSGSYISFQGWYEFQKVNNVDRKQIPNFFLVTKIIF